MNNQKCIKNISSHSTQQELYDFYNTLYNCWKISNGDIFNDPVITQILERLLLQTSGKYIYYPNGIYVKLLVGTIFMDLDEIKKDKDFTKFLIHFYTFLEEARITGIIPLTNNNIKNKLLQYKQLYNMSSLDENNISNTHMVMLLQSR